MDEIPCAEDGCEESFPNHRWGRIRSHDDGWFHSRREGKSYCPDHVPEWVWAWRDIVGSTAHV